MDKWYHWVIYLALIVVLFFVGVKSYKAIYGGMIKECVREVLVEEGLVK